MIHLAALRIAAANETGALNSDLFDMIAQGCENADDTLGAECDPEGVEYSDIACGTIACNLSERDFTPRYGTSAATVRAWFLAHEISF